MTNPLREPARFLEVVVAAILAVQAVDGERLSTDWPLEAAASLGVVAIAGLLIATRRSTAPLGADYTTYATPLLLPIAWVLWAALAPLAPAGLSTLTLAGAYGALLLAMAEIASRSGAAGVARTIVIGFVLHLLLALGIIATTDLDPFLDSRLQLVSLEANQLARIGVLSAVSAFYLVTTSATTTTLHRLLLASVGTVSLVVVVSTASRTGAVGMVVGLGLVAAHRLPWRSVLLGISTALLLLALVLVGTTVELPGSTTTIAERSTEGGGTLSGRNKLWPEVFAKSLDHPVTGIGLGEDRAFMREEINVGWDPQHTHNLWLHLLLTTGVIGLALASAAMFGGLLTAVIARQTLAVALLAVVIVDGISEPVIRVPSFGWAALAGALALSVASADGHADRSTARR